MVPASCSTRGPLPPLCLYVIISSTPSLPCLLPSPNRHITKHTQWHCAFSHHHFWHSMRRHPLPGLLPSAHFWCVGWRQAWSLIERFIMLSKGGNGAALSRSAGGGIRGSGGRAPAAAHRGFSHSVCKTPAEGTNRFKIWTSHALLTQTKKTWTVKENASSGCVICYKCGQCCVMNVAFFVYFSSQMSMNFSFPFEQHRFLFKFELVYSVCRYS